MAERNYAIESGDTGKSLVAPVLPYRPPVPRQYRPKIGMIACGGITESHLSAYKQAGYEVAAFFDIHPERAEARRKQFYPGARVAASAEEIFGDDSIEVVDIATHPPERLALIRAALESGKHVLSQKPFVLNLDDGEALADLADAKGVRLAVNQNGRWAPHVAYLREAVRAGLAGDVLGVHMGVHWNHDWVAGTPFDEVKHVVLYDFAIHWFDMLACYTQGRRATRVYASTAFATGQTAKPPLLGQALVEFEGAQASLAFDAFARFGSLDTTLIVGSEGTLSSTGPDLGRQTVTYTNAEGTASPVLDGTWFNDGFRGTMGELLCAIEEGREPQNSARNNLQSLALCFAALRAADTGVPQVPGSVRTA